MAAISEDRPHFYRADRGLAGQLYDKIHAGEAQPGEFSIYLLLGMKKKKIASLYMRENLLMGTGAFFLGMLLGTLLQQIIMSVLYSMIQMKYDLHLEFNRYCILMTAACYAGCYLLAFQMPEDLRK